MDLQYERLKIVDSILFSLILGFASGVIFNAFVPLTSLVFTTVAVLAVCSLVITWGLGPQVKGQVSRLLACLAIFLFASLLGMYRSEIARPDASLFLDSVGTAVTVGGTIISEPKQKTSGQQFTLDAGGLNMLVTAPAFPELLYGDSITAVGVIETPENFMTDQGTEFDYVSYLYKDDVLYLMPHARVYVVSQGHGSWIIRRLLHAKNWIRDGFYRTLPARDADLLSGINLGEKSAIDSDFRNDLITTGTIHIIALSGYNVTVIANNMRDLFTDIFGFSARASAWFGALGIVLFVAMTGLQSSAIRAGIMALIGLFARGKGRTYNAFRALVLAGFLMVVWNPKYLVYDVSFQLSFLATLGIIFITPVLERNFARVPKKLLWVIPLREGLSVTLGAQLGVLPFILYSMGTLSLISLPANILILPAIPLVMAFGTLAGLLGSFSAGLALPFSFVTHTLLLYMTTIIRWLAQAPYASVVLRNFPFVLCILLYFILWFWVYRSWRHAQM